MGNRYDHRLRNAIVNSGNPNLFRELNIPASTVRDWLRKGPIDVVTVTELDYSVENLVQKIESLKEELEREKTKSQLLIKSISAIGFQLQYRRFPSPDVKHELIDIIKKAATILPLSDCLEIIKLSTVFDVTGFFWTLFSLTV